ncbi:MAG: 6-phosphogluconolactonase [Chlamydiae bacterium CG10_big_fil_rev_8_21_14_0_10_42_34]|nr:MAG: 6-phosphogluconolactonase [Chlamydiae bacterium CG10_big_fil_rev_8_21_14_0_10_42_34]
MKIESWDDRRDYIIPGDAKQTIDFAAEHWIHSYERSVQQRGRFAVALSGGSTPKAIYEILGKEKLDGSKIWLFWSDERAVPPSHPDSNYKMAMESGLANLNIPPSQIFRMVAEKDIEKNALDYEEKIRHYLGKTLFDLVMLGVGEDGHTASLFPESAALQEETRLVMPNYISEKKCWRMTLTYPCINQSFHTVIYAIGKSKHLIIPQILNAAIVSKYPASSIGNSINKCLYILDNSASSLLK